MSELTTTLNGTPNQLLTSLGLAFLTLKWRGRPNPSLLAREAGEAIVLLHLFLDEEKKVNLHLAANKSI